MEFAAIAKIDLADAVLSRIRDAILLGELAPGDTLASERELAVQFGVNRTTVREGLSRLERLGLIDRRQGARCRVTDYHTSGSLELLADLARLGHRDVGPSITEAVAILYRGTVALALERATEADGIELDRLATALEAEVAAGVIATVVTAERAFHHGVAAAARSVALELVMNSFYETLDVTLDTQGAIKGSVARMLIAYLARGGVLPQRRLADAIARHDTDAANVAVDAMFNALAVRVPTS